MSHFHNLAYSDQNKDNPNRRQHIRDIIFLRTAIAFYFREKFRALNSEYDKHYKQLIKTYFERSHITKDNVFFVTTNYDLGIEIVIEDLFGSTEYYYPGKAFSKQSSTGSEIPIFKLHGSINWMENRGPSSSEKFANHPRKDLRLYTDNLEELKIKPLSKTHELSLQDSNGNKFTPILIPFFYQKHEWLKQNEGWEALFSATWGQTRSYMENADKLLFWGYSLPPADHYIFTFLANIIESTRPKCCVVDLSDCPKLNTMLAKMLRYLYQGKEEYYSEYKTGMIDYLKR